MSSSPVRIHEFDHPQTKNTTRQQYFIDKNKEMASTGKMPRNFSFQTFQTNKQRINYLLETQGRNSNQNMQDTNSNINIKKSSENIFSDNSKPIFIQPSMRFRPRTELERIYDSVNKYSFGRADKEIINEQLKSLDLYDTKKIPQEGEPFEN